MTQHYPLPHALHYLKAVSDGDGYRAWYLAWAMNYLVMLYERGYHGVWDG